MSALFAPAYFLANILLGFLALLMSKMNFDE